jgi:hypothetical protein
MSAALEEARTALLKRALDITTNTWADAEFVRALCVSAREYTAAYDKARSEAKPVPSAGSGVVFPNYGRSKGLPVAGASKGDLEFYRGGCLRTLGDPSKSRWHDKERALLAAIDLELGDGDDDPFNTAVQDADMRWDQR